MEYGYKALWVKVTPFFDDLNYYYGLLKIEYGLSIFNANYLISKKDPNISKLFLEFSHIHYNLSLSFLLKSFFKHFIANNLYNPQEWHSYFLNSDAPK